MKILKYILITLIALVVIAVGAVMIFDEETPFATMTSNGVTVEVYGARRAKNLSSSSTPSGQKITVDDNEVIFGEGRLTVNGVEHKIGPPNKVSIRLKRGKLVVESE